MSKRMSQGLLNRVSQIGEHVIFNDVLLDNIGRSKFTDYRGSVLRITKSERRSPPNTKDKVWRVKFWDLTRNKKDMILMKEDGTIAGPTQPLVGVMVFKLLDGPAVSSSSTPTTNHTYCTCGGPSKLVGFGTLSFSICTKCKLEKQD